uniref:NADH-ubiquinone oxidoreductase chain 5 n=1 Tax=Margaritifera margaritifera TaxID=2505931 RepID=A0A4Y5QVQ6_9BIVA|nr:NADH dehydrogenase subunit 5 [Margaritifera margaritifera]
MTAKPVSGVISLMLWGGSFLSSSILLVAMSFMGVLSGGLLIEWEFFSCCGSGFGFPVILDYTSVLFSLVVCFISMCVFFFSVEYMEGGSDKSLRLFGLLVGGFVLAMNALIFVPSLISLLLGWDALGIVSFMLVIFYQNKSSLYAGMLTVLTNRIGDSFLILSIGLGLDFGDWGIMAMESCGVYCLLVGGLIMLASMTKSAQIPFSAWLPAAMAAPTPVSALVHSSTLVTAGVYLLFRFYYTLVSIEGLLEVLAKIGCLTVIMGGAGACLEEDIKKMIALSTLSHLGVMVYALGSGYPSLAMFHLFMHALFKSLLFLCAGYFIHVGGSCQDIRQLCGVGWWSSVSVCCVVVGLNSLTGFIALSGFYSKDGILESCVVNVGGPFEIFSLLAGVCTSCVYSNRIYVLLIWGPPSGSPLLVCAHEPFFIGLSLIVLAVGGVVGGFVFQMVWIDYCPLVIVGPATKMFLFVSLNLGNFFMAGRGCVSYYRYLGTGSEGEGSGVKPFSLFFAFISFVSGMMNLRFISGKMVFSMWLEFGGVVGDCLEGGWMEVVGGQGMFKSLQIPVSIMDTLWRMDSLTVLRFQVVSGIVVYLLLLADPSV